MTKTTPPKEKGKHPKIDNLRPRVPRKPDEVKGGKTPSPGGPIPIPYPNVSQKG